jgi:hypothetical protein
VGTGLSLSALPVAVQTERSSDDLLDEVRG